MDEQEQTAWRNEPCISQVGGLRDGEDGPCWLVDIDSNEEITSDPQEGLAAQGNVDRGSRVEQLAPCLGLVGMRNLSRT
jgi:hypothetical protein